MAAADRVAGTLPYPFTRGIWINSGVERRVLLGGESGVSGGG
jgi:hypothetical protein